MEAARGGAAHVPLQVGTFFTGLQRTSCGENISSQQDRVATGVEIPGVALPADEVPLRKGSAPSHLEEGAILAQQAHESKRDLDQLLIWQGPAPHLEVRHFAMNCERGGASVSAPRSHNVYLLRVCCIGVLHILESIFYCVVLLCVCDISVYHLHVRLVKVLLPILKQCNTASLGKPTYDNIVAFKYF